MNIKHIQINMWKINFENEVKIIPTMLDGVVIIEPTVYSDDRGYFFESYNRKAFEKVGLSCAFIQDNQSKSSYGTIRGIHFQKGEFAQAKLVRVIAGKVLDVAVDLRTGSPTFGRHVAIELSEDDCRQMLIPRGFGHGFSVLSETAVLAYKCDNDYVPLSEGSIRFNDPDLGIDWCVDVSCVLLSEKDKYAPFLAELKNSPVFFYEK